MSIVPLALMNKAPNCLISQFLCDESVCTSYFTRCTTKIIRGDDYEWAVRLQCSICNKIWWLCKTCNLRKKLLMKMQINKHQYSFHGNQRPLPPKKNRNIMQSDYIYMNDNEDTGERFCSIIDFNNDNSNDASINESNMIEDSKIAAIDGKELWISKDVSNEIRTTMNDIIKGNNGIHYINEKCAEYYAYNIISSGAKFLVTKMWSNEEGDPSDVFQRITNEEVKCQAAIGMFCETLSRSQQEEFGNLLNMIKRSYFNNDSQVVCNLPTSLSDVRRLYIDGKESYSKNLPIPNIYQLKKHSYVSIIDCIADFLYSNNNDLSNLEDTRTLRLNYVPTMTIFGNDRASAIIESAHNRMWSNNVESKKGDNIIVLFLKLWSDDFDPNTSVKSNRQSVWVKTVSIFARLKNGNKVTYTYPIATSPKGDNHDEVDLRISHDLEKLRSGPFLTFFCRNTLKPIHVHADIYCVLADQPERRTNLMIAAGNSTNHKRFGYVLDYQHLLNVIRPCLACQLNVEEHVDKYKDERRMIIDAGTRNFLLTECTECTNWMLSDEHPLLKYIPDKHYPMDKLDETGLLGYRRITRHNLQTCVDDVDNKLETEEWTVVTSKSYLKSEGYNQKAVDSIVDHTQNRIAYKKAIDAYEVNGDNDRHNLAIISDHDKNPLHYEKWKLPYSWKLAEDTQLHVDVPMHLLFLGVGRSVFKKINYWLKLKWKSSEFKEMTKGKLDQLKSYNLEWCKIIQYPQGSSDKFGGWVAENFLGFIRISSWFYSMLTQLKEKNDLRLLDTPYTAWKVKENKMWLEIRGLETNGNAKELKDRVREHIESDSTPNIITIESENTSDVLTLINVLIEMVGVILSHHTTYDMIDYVELIIRKFLNYYDKLDKLVLNEKQQPSWLTQYNFLSLLNIPSIMRKYGCYRNIWEGGIEGEGFLRKYKSELKNGLKHNWQIWTIKNLLQSNVFEKENLENVKSWKATLVSECRIYQQHITFLNLFNDGKPISGMFNNYNKEIYICFRIKTIIKCIILQINWRIFETYCNMKYYKVTADTTMMYVDKELVSKSTGCILLPKLYKQEHEQHTYCIVFSDWRRNVFY